MVLFLPRLGLTDPDLQVTNRRWRVVLGARCRSMSQPWRSVMTAVLAQAAVCRNSNTGNLLQGPGPAITGWQMHFQRDSPRDTLAPPSLDVISMTRHRLVC